MMSVVWAEKKYILLLVFRPHRKHLDFRTRFLADDMSSFRIIPSLVAIIRVLQLKKFKCSMSKTGPYIHGFEEWIIFALMQLWNLIHEIDSEVDFGIFLSKA